MASQLGAGLGLRSPACDPAASQWRGSRRGSGPSPTLGLLPAPAQNALSSASATFAPRALSGRFASGPRSVFSARPNVMAFAATSATPEDWEEKVIQARSGRRMADTSSDPATPALG